MSNQDAYIGTLIDATAEVIEAIIRGGPGSGHHGHKGRPGEVGGSLPAEAGTAESWEAHLLDRYGEADYQNATWIGPSGKLLGPGGDHQAHAFELLGIRQDLFTSEGRKEGMRATNEVVKGGLIRLNIFRSKVHMGSKEVYFDTPDFDKLTDEQKTTMAVVITQVARESGKVIGAVINEGGVMGRGEDKTIFDEEAYEFLGLAWHDPLARRGGPGSGHHGHEGRPGEVGGSLPSGAVSVSRPKGDWISAAEKNLESDELDVTNLAGAGFVISPTGRVFGRIGNASLFGYHWQLAQLSIKDHRDEIEASLPERDYDDYGSYDDMDLSGWGLGFIRGYITQRTNELSLYVMTVPNRSQTRTIKDIYEFNDIVSFHWEQDLDPTPDPDKLEYATYNLSGDVRDFNKSFAKFRYFLGLTIRGGPGSGHHGHRGRPGKVGGSLPSDAVGDNLSDLLKVPQTPLWDSINRALQNIDSVHGVYPMRPLRVFRSKATRRRGSYHAIIGPDGDLVPDKLGVVLDKGGEDRTLTRSITLAHEIAHYLDHDMFGRNRYFTTEDMIDGDAETGDDYATLNMISTNLEEARAFQKWWSAIKSSDAYEEMQNFDTGFRYMDSDGNLIRGFPPPDQMTTKIYQYTPQMLRSWRQPNEFFARSYAQWIATRSGDPVMINELNDEREFTRLGGAPTQWEDDDFEMIAGAFDELFDSLGLLR